MRDWWFNYSGAIWCIINHIAHWHWHRCNIMARYDMPCHMFPPQLILVRFAQKTMVMPISTLAPLWPMHGVALLMVTHHSHSYATSKWSHCVSALTSAFIYDMIHVDRKIAMLGFTQSFFEGAMYVFVFMWTPALESTSDQKISHGTTTLTPRALRSDGWWAWWWHAQAGSLHHSWYAAISCITCALSYMWLWLWCHRYVQWLVATYFACWWNKDIK